MYGKRIYRPFEPIDKEKRLQEHFKTIRMATGMTTVEFASKIGVSRQLINAIENGSREITYIVYLGVEALVSDLSTNGFLCDLWDILVEHDSDENYGGYPQEFIDYAAYWGSIIAGAISAGVISVSKANDAWEELDSLASGQ